MFNKNKKLIEKIVDIKEAVNQILLGILVVLFPLNQQYHFRPFPSVDGFIIDYLILKVSVLEVLIISLFIINFNKIVETSKFLFRNYLFWVLLFFILMSVLRSKYFILSIYENLLLFIYFFLGIFLYKNLNLINLQYLTKSIKFWILSLCFLGFAQFYNQGSVLNNYYIFGEFPYSSDHYHVKQKSIIFENLIPPYAIFSHSNIFGAFLILMLFFLRLLKSESKFYYFIVFSTLLIIGSSACLIAFIMFILSLRLNLSQLRHTIFYFLIICSAFLFLNSYRFQDYSGDYSIYRRLYMIDLSLNYFINNPVNLFIGAGYYNYFFEVKDYLYSYEIVRFFQPQHFGAFFVIWQYGLFFVLIVLFFLLKNSSRFNSEFLRFLLLIAVFSCFDHYIFTNHQFKVLILLIIPYSLKMKNSI